MIRIIFIILYEPIYNNYLICMICILYAFMDYHIVSTNKTFLTTYKTYRKVVPHPLILYSPFNFSLYY